MVVKGLFHLLEAPERLSWECIELVVGNALETGLEHMTQESEASHCESGPSSCPGLD